MRNSLKWFSIATIALIVVLAFSAEGDGDIILGGLMFAVSPTLALVYLGLEKKS